MSRLLGPDGSQAIPEPVPVKCSIATDYKGLYKLEFNTPVTQLSVVIDKEHLTKIHGMIADAINQSQPGKNHRGG